MKKVIVSTNNQNKLKEIKLIFHELGYEVLSKKEAGIDDFDVDETGTTLEENAYIKAKALRDMVDCAVISDDSGLFCDGLYGEPGIYSARYAGEHGDDHKNNYLLLKNLEGRDRTAHFKSVICFIDEDNKVFYGHGNVDGEILYEYRGTGGFGYDPLFLPKGHDKTYAEIGTEEKNKFSHRKRALEDIKEKILLEEKHKELYKKVDFALTLDEMKNIFRVNKIADGSRRENDAEHSFHAAVLAPVFKNMGKFEVDANKTAVLLLYHDLIEIYAGDTYCYDTKGNESKKQRESEAADKLYSKLDSLGAELRKYWEEFEAAETNEAKYANALDRFQPLLMHFAFNSHSWQDHKITKEAVLKRMAPIKIYSDEMYDFVLDYVESQFKKEEMI